MFIGQMGLGFAQVGSTALGYFRAWPVR